MKKTILLSMSLLTTGLMAGTDINYLSTEKLKEIKASIKSLQNPSLRIKKGKDLKTVYFLQLEVKGPKGSRNIEGFVDKTTGALYLGGGYDKDGKKFTFPANLKLVKDSVAFTYGTGKKDLYLVTDPECPYCKKFYIETEGKLSDYKVHVIFMPLAFHKEAKPMTNYILAGKTEKEKYERYASIMTGGTDYKKLKIEGNVLSDYLKKSNKAVSELGARGTPSTFVGDDLKAFPWPQLIAAKPAVKVEKVEKAVKTVKQTTK